MKTSTFVSKQQIDETLATAPTPGKKLLEPFKTFSKEHNLPFNILEDKEISNDPEIHMHEADLWYCLEGEVTFVHGGTMVEPFFKKKPDGTENPNEIGAKSIQGGTEVVMHPGDWLWIPAGEPHQHICSVLTRLMIIKIPKR